MNWETLACFGDSITHGARTYLGYPEYIGDILQEKVGNSWNVINISSNGLRACDLLRKITEEGYNISHYNPVFFTLLIGTNDVKKATSLMEFRIAYDQLVLKILLLTKHKSGILISIPTFRKGLKYPYKFDMNTNLHEYNAVINDMGKKYGLEVLDLTLEDEDFFDGIHLNEKGVLNVSVQIANYMLKEKGLTRS